MHSILVIQFRLKPELIEDERKVFEKVMDGNNVSFSFINALNGDVDWKVPEKILEGYDALILGGSGEFDFDGGRAFDDVQRKISHETLDKMRFFLEFVLERDIPMLGICFGHQIMAALKDINVVHDHSQAKTGTFEVQILPEYRDDPIFKDIPDKFAAQYGHKDSLEALPEGARLIINGSDCKFSGLKYSDVIYSFQFHPEMDEADVIRRLEMTPGYLKDGVSPQDVVSSSPYVTLLLKNFIEKIIPLKS